MSVPAYDALPAPLWIIQALHVLTLTLHFVAMNLVLGGLVLLVLGRRRGGSPGPGAQRLVRLLPSAMAATVTLGVAPLLFLQLVHPGPAYSAAIASGWLWLLIVAAAIAAYYLFYAAAFAPPGGRAGLWLALPAVLYVSFVYSTVFSMAERPDIYAALYAANPAGTSPNPEPGIWAPRWLHMVTGAVAVGGCLAGLFAADDEPLRRRARLFCTGGMAVAILTGMAYLLSLSDVMQPIMRGSAVWVMTASIFLALGALHLLWKDRLAAAGAAIFLSLLGMVVLRHQVRLIHLGDAFSPASIPVQPQWGVFALFLACFAGGLAVCAWMGVLFARSARRPAPAGS